MPGVVAYTESDVWACLADVPDPEIPVVSLMELGIIRDVDATGAAPIVTITPTYSGCPATAVIQLDVETALAVAGFEGAKVISKLSPAWTTDWITSEGRAKLKDYGIAPPAGSATCAGMLAQSRSAATISCPRCDSEKTERVSQFGSTPCKAHYRCLSCLEPFDYFKPI